MIAGFGASHGQCFVERVVRRFGNLGKAWWGSRWCRLFLSVWPSHGKLKMDDDYYSIDSILAENQVGTELVGHMRD